MSVKRFTRGGTFGDWVQYCDYEMMEDYADFQRDRAEQLTAVLMDVVNTLDNPHDHGYDEIEGIIRAWQNTKGGQP